jgi:hypothetical protein
MDTFEWQLDLQFVLPDGTRLKALQRTVTDSRIFTDDIKPFYHEPAVWVARAVGGQPSIGEGYLKRYTPSKRADVFVLSFVDGRAIEVSLQQVCERQLTVWRYRGNFDMLQIRVNGEGTSLYGQTGGQKTLAAFADLQTTNTHHKDLRTAIGLYRSGRLDPNPSSSNT